MQIMPFYVGCFQALNLFYSFIYHPFLALKVQNFSFPVALVSSNGLYLMGVCVSFHSKVGDFPLTTHFIMIQDMF